MVDIAIRQLWFINQQTSLGGAQSCIDSWGKNVAMKIENSPRNPWRFSPENSGHSVYKNMDFPHKNRDG